MPRDLPFRPMTDRVAGLNARYRHHGATAVLEHILRDRDVGRVALVSSFGAESVVLLHLLSVISPHTPVLFIDTQMLFPETLAYQEKLAQKLYLTDIRRLGPAPARLVAGDPDGTLHRTNPDACCALRKTAVLDRALSGFDAWITGRKRYQSANRAQVEFFESDGEARLKINPLAHWSRDDLSDYMINNRLPRHPLVAKGYPSIGCAPCTSPVNLGEDPRAGRWRGNEKTECGIHFVNGKLTRSLQETKA
ncbi:phosphoadenylyl-sulfate reductase [Pseudorhodobacter sp.]|uniref:phosphoadenylyl-sulfate reductase n=1 Tax=Pseudorhodobacter sp. TaxID=1934400 RepID=UPI002648D5CC|nr:phosphoadenylyl-sulfate reductase [Pseudorhodobacter sp.]MDN5788527.1 phosphoadenylyl-sulfate reductase [Pseudorhodobacter sp.]